MTGFEPVTSSLPRKHSTPELRRLILNLWGEQDSNLRRFPNGFTVRPRWPLEYLPLRYFYFSLTIMYMIVYVGRAGFEPAKVSQRIYSPSSLAA